MQNRYNRSYFINSSSFLSPPIPIQIRNFKPIISLFKAFSSLQWSLQEWQEIHQILSSFNSKSILFFTIHFRSTIATNLSRFRVFSQVLTSTLSMASAFDTFTLKCWYGGNFKTNGVGLQYLGGEFKTLVVDPNIISWFDLEELVDTSVGIKYPHTLYYLLPNCLTFEEGLRNINSDACVLEMASIGAKERAIDVYIVREEDDESLFVCINKKLKLSIGGNIDGERRKLTPRRAQTVNLDKEKGNVVNGEGGHRVAWQGRCLHKHLKMWSFVQRKHLPRVYQIMCSYSS